MSYRLPVCGRLFLIDQRIQPIGIQMSKIYPTVVIKQQTTAFARPSIVDVFGINSLFGPNSHVKTKSTSAKKLAEFVFESEFPQHLDGIVIVKSDCDLCLLRLPESLESNFAAEISEKRVMVRSKSLIFQINSGTGLTPQRSRNSRIRRGSVHVACGSSYVIVVPIRSYCVCGQSLFTVELTHSERFSLAFDLTTLNFYGGIGYVSAAISTLIISKEAAFCETQISASKFSLTKSSPVTIFSLKNSSISPVEFKTACRYVQRAEQAHAMYTHPCFLRDSRPDPGADLIFRGADRG